MTITPTELAETSNTSASSISTGSVAASTGDYVLVRVGSGKWPNSGTHNSVTFDGNALTKLVEASPATTGNANEVISSIWGLKLTGDITGVVTATFGDTNSSNFIHVFKISGFDGTTPIGDTDIVGNWDSSGVPRELTLTTVAGDFVFDAISAQTEFGNSISITGGQTSDYHTNTSAHSFGASREEATGSSTTVSWSATVDWQYNYCAVVVKVASGGSTIVRLIDGGKGWNPLLGGLVS